MSEVVEWNIQKVVSWTTQHFENKNLPSARLDAEVLLSHVLGCKRLDLYLKFDQPITETERATFKEMIKRRSTGEPVAYIVGTKEFYGREFNVSPSVLIPRPETEHIIDEAKRCQATKGLAPHHILDVATGSGCLAVTLKKELIGADVKAIDVSGAALEVAKLNALKHEAELDFICEDFVKWAQGNSDCFDLVVSNPPYVANGAQLMKDVKNFEPALALYGGEKGSEILIQWLPLLISKLKPGGLLLCEMGYDQRSAVEDLLSKRADIELDFIKDYSGHNRIIKIKKG